MGGVGDGGGGVYVYRGPWRNADLRDRYARVCVSVCVRLDCDMIYGRVHACRQRRPIKLGKQNGLLSCCWRVDFYGGWVRVWLVTDERRIWLFGKVWMLSNFPP